MGVADLRSILSNMTNAKSGGGSGGGGSIDPNDIEKMILYFGYHWSDTKTTEITKTIEITITDEPIDISSDRSRLLYIEIICKDITIILRTEDMLNYSFQSYSQLKYENTYHTYIVMPVYEENNGYDIYLYVNHITSDHVLIGYDMYNEDYTPVGDILCKLFVEHRDY